MRQPALLSGVRPSLAALLLAMAAVLLPSCHHQLKEHGASEAVQFEGIEFRLNSKETRYAPISASGQPHPPSNGVFVIVEVSLRSSYSTPVPAQFQPRFMLMDWRGREHPPSERLTSALNQGHSAGALSPGVSYTRKVVFDVPEGGYKLRVFMPVVVKTGGEGSTYKGRAFLFELK